MARLPGADADVVARAEHAYVFSYPLLLSQRAMRRANRLFLGPGPADTMRISGWLDLGSQPRALSLDDTFGRYYVVWLRDAWNNVYASVGARSTGTAARAFAVLGPTRRGDRLPAPLSPIAAPTRITRVSGCIEAVGATAPELAARVRVCDLSRWAGVGSGIPLTPVERDDDDLPSRVAEVERMDAASHFAEALRLAADNPPEADDRPALDELGAVLAGGERRSLEEGARRGREAIRRAAEAGGEHAGPWRFEYDLGRYGRDHLRRAAAARRGRGVEPAPDELTGVAEQDADGRPLTGRGRYLLRFPPRATPPAGAFWTLATPAGSTGGLRGLTLDADGSLPIHIQRDAPEYGGNWLPAPAGRFSLVLRLYWPSEQALDRRWTPPAPSRLAAA